MRDIGDVNHEARAIIAALGLVPHPEGGFYRETYRAPLALRAPQGERAASTAIYFLLPASGLSALHRVRSDEVWHHYAGGAVAVHAIDEATRAHVVHRVGPDLVGGERPQLVGPAGTWQATVAPGPRWALCGCTVAPGFDFADFEMPTRDALTARMPELRAVIESLTHSRG